MAKTECVWFRNKLTGYVDGVDKGSAAHRRMLTESTEDEDGTPFIVWEETEAPTVKSQKYTPGMQAEVQVPDDPRERAEHPPERDPSEVRADRNAQPRRDPGKQSGASAPPAGAAQ